MMPGYNEFRFGILMLVAAAIASFVIYNVSGGAIFLVATGIIILALLITSYGGLLMLSFLIKPKSERKRIKDNAYGKQILSWVKMGNDKSAALEIRIARSVFGDDLIDVVLSRIPYEKIMSRSGASEKDIKLDKTTARKVLLVILTLEAHKVTWADYTSKTMLNSYKLLSSDVAHLRGKAADIVKDSPDDDVLFDRLVTAADALNG